MAFLTSHSTVPTLLKRDINVLEGFVREYKQLPWVGDINRDPCIWGLFRRWRSDSTHTRRAVWFGLVCRYEVVKTPRQITGQNAARTAAVTQHKALKYAAKHDSFVGLHKCLWQKTPAALSV